MYIYKLSHFIVHLKHIVNQLYFNKKIKKNNS